MTSKQLFPKEMLETRPSESSDAFVYFEKRLSFVLTEYLYESPSVDLLSQAEKQMIFDLLWSVLPPKRQPENAISDSELNMIEEGYQEIIHEFRLMYEGKPISLLDFNILAAFYHVLYHRIESKGRARKLKQAFAVPSLEGISLLKKVPGYYSGCMAILLSRLNDVRKKYYVFEMKRSEDPVHLNMTLSPVLSVYWVRQESLVIHRSRRLVYKLFRPGYASGIQGLMIPKSKLGQHYQGAKDALHLYIQDDAIKGLATSLDIFDQRSVNTILNLNLALWNDIEYYKGNLLLPLQICQIHVGYWVCNVVEDKLVARTFRLITHNNTPQGDRLSDVFGRSKLDIKNWNRDRLSFFTKVENQEVIRLYKEAGFNELFRLKDFNLNIEVMQEANYKDFLAYIREGEQTEACVGGRSHEALELQNQSLGKLVYLLLLNTAGWIAGLFFKMMYSVVFWFRGLSKLHSEEKFEGVNQKRVGLSNDELPMQKEYDLSHDESKVLEEQIG